MLRPSRVLELWSVLSATWCMKYVGSAELDSDTPGILVPWCTAARSLRLKQKHHLRHDHRLETSLKKVFHLYSFISQKYYILLVRIISYRGYFNYFSSTFFIRDQPCWHLKRTVKFNKNYFPLHLY